MRLAFSLLALLGLLAAGPLHASPVDMGDNPARALAAMAARQELPEGDPRVAQARAWLKQAAAATGEHETFIAAACAKMSKHLFDMLRVRATPLEPLEALATHAPPGKPMGDTTAAYFEARRLAPNKTHAEAMAALAARQ